MDQQLVVFATVAKEQSFTRAAEKLHISQPAISQHIQNLEQRLSVKLFDRTNKYVRLNKAGDIVYHYANEILGMYEEMERLVQDLKGSPTGPLRIGASFTFGEYVLPHLVARFRELYANITPAITIANTHAIVEQVSHGELDVGVIEGTTIDENNVEVEIFAKDTVVIVASSHHRLTGKDPVNSAILKEETWIVREQGSGTREVTDFMFRTFGIEPRFVVEFGSTQVIKESVEAGLGISLLSKWAIRKELAWNILKEIVISNTPITRNFSIVVRKSSFETKASQVFREFLRAQAPALANFDL